MCPRLFNIFLIFHSNRNRVTLKTILMYNLYSSYIIYYSYMVLTLVIIKKRQRLYFKTSPALQKN